MLKRKRREDVETTTNSTNLQYYIIDYINLNHKTEKKFSLFFNFSEYNYPILREREKKKIIILLLLLLNNSFVFVVVC